MMMIKNNSEKNRLNGCWWCISEQKKWNENETTIRENIPQTHTTTRDSRQTRINTYRIRRRMYRNIFNEKKTRKKTERRKTEKTERKENQNEI